MPARPARPARTRRQSRAGRIPLWIPLALCGAAAAWLVHDLEASADAAGFARVDTARTRLEAGGAWCDPAWERELALAMAALPPLDPREPADLERAARGAAVLPFVARVREARVLWPDGIELALELRKPVACARTGSGYVLIAEDGVALPGRAGEPPRVDGAPLPVLGPDDPQRFELLRPGARLAAGPDLDGLALARAFAAALTPEQRALLAPVEIDASRARLASAEEPGARLACGSGRAIWYGRAPGHGAVGELPDELKWEHVRRALRTLADGGRDWSLLDVRWDLPDIAWRAAGQPGAPPP
jgi:hypothetical protein